jgi:L-ascorbate metabolism protein UlaG (beta-lactamase superfamily)
MKRRHFLQTAGASAVGAIAGSFLLNSNQSVQAQTGSVTVEWYGHTCFLISGGGVKILVNPFKPLGCTAGYKKPFPKADIVLITSQLFDEGYVETLEGKPTILWQAGQFAVNGLTFNGISLDHANIERFRGWRFPTNVAWSWEQGGINFLHLGAAGEVVDVEDFIITGIPDVVMLPVGGTDAYADASPSFPPKGYTPSQAIAALEVLKPKLILPTHYLTTAATDTCRLNPVDDFLGLLTAETATVKKATTNRISLSPASLPKDKSEVMVLSDRPLL